MTGNTLTHRLVAAIVAVFAAFATALAQSQDDSLRVYAPADSIEVASAVSDSIDIVTERALAEADSLVGIIDTLSVNLATIAADSTFLSHISRTVSPKAFVPDPKRSMWMAIIIPGGGQIYNRKYWKLPLIYGGFLGCAYALNWNNTMYRDYSQAYIDIMDSDPNTKSYMNFVPARYDIDANMDRLRDLFRRKKDFYRRYRDMSIFCMIGVYALSIIDAYVDAEMSSFDISTDLSLKVHPAIINDRYTTHTPTLRSQSYGVQCSLTF